MARIPDEEIERLKKEVSLEGLVKGSGSNCANMAPISTGGVRFTTTGSRRWW